MRQLSVLTAVTLLVAAVAGSAYAGALVATDPPDIRLTVGTPLSGAFDLNDYFVGGVMADGVVDIAGSADVGITDQTYDITVGADTVTVGNKVKVSTFLVANGAAIDGLAAGGGGNPFVNVLRPGVSASSVQALVGAADGGAATPGAVTGPAWYITMANVSSSYTDGLRVRSASLVAQSDGPSLDAAGLLAEIDEAGNYKLTAQDGFGGPVVVTFVSQGAGGIDGASVLAAGEISVGDNFADNDKSQDVTAGADPVQVPYSAVSVAGPVTVAIDCTPAADGVSVALAALDGSMSGDLSYVNPSGDSKAGQTMRLAVTYDAASGSVLPLVQVVGGTANFANLAVYRAPAITDLAVGANALDLASMAGAPVNGNFDSVTLADLSPNLPNSAPGTVNLGAGTVLLGEDGAGFDNVTVVAAAGSPANIGARVMAKGTGRCDIVITALLNFAPAASIGQFRTIDNANFAPISIVGQIANADTVWVTVQGFGGGQDAIEVDNLVVTQVQDLDEYCDVDLLGL
jgi:hypothetical protein